MIYPNTKAIYLNQFFLMIHKLQHLIRLYITYVKAVGSVFPNKIKYMQLPTYHPKATDPETIHFQCIYDTKNYRTIMASIIPWINIYHKYIYTHHIIQKQRKLCIYINSNQTKDIMNKNPMKTITIRETESQNKTHDHLRI